MLLNVTGSSCAGKSTLVWRAVSLLGRDDVHAADFDQIGVPDDADADWRHVANEHWVRRALDLESEGRHLVLASQTPLGELLATPSTDQLQGIGNVLVDVADEVRLQRLEQRDPGKWPAATLEAFVGWGEWHRQHARDPQHAPEVIVTDSSVAMCWDRWLTWRAGDPRWSTQVIDTTNRSVESSSEDLAGWIANQLDEFSSGTLPLGQEWAR